MFGSVIVDVAIGVIFVYFLLSLIGSAVNELTSQLLSLRSKYLEEGIKTILGDPAFAERLYDHALIRSFTRDGRKPSYIPSRAFALALVDIVAPVDPSKDTRSMVNVRESINKIQVEGLKKCLLANLEHAQSDISRAYQGIEKWFDEGMERVSGWYKRASQWIILIYALLIAVAFNVDTISMTHSLYRNENLRVGLVAAAQNAVSQPSTEGSLKARDQIAAINSQLTELNLPIGWKGHLPTEWYEWPIKVCGWLITALAVSLGSPFWFDMLSKIISIRSTGKRPEKE